MQHDSILLKGGRVLCPASDTDALADVLIERGEIRSVGEVSVSSDTRVVDCTNRVIAPGFTDLGAELCDPGKVWREDLSTGSEAAAAGGFTTVVASPRTDPVIDNPVAVSDALGRARSVSGARIELAGALTIGLKGQNMSELGLMAEAGAVAFSDGRRPMMNAALFRRSLDYARPFGLPIIIRPGDVDLEGAGVMHEGEVSTQVGLRGIPGAAEEIGVGRAVAMARLTGARIHLSQVTTAASVGILRTAKADGVLITASAPARHLFLTDRQVDTSVYCTSTRMLPPLRSESDRQALIAGVMDGTVDSVTADHVPLTRLEKEMEYMVAKPGAMGLETAFRAAFTALGDLRKTIEALAVGPARVLGRTAKVASGHLADIVVVDPNFEGKVSGPYRSKGHNEPLEGVTLRGEILLTVRDGCIIYGPQSD